MLILVSTGSLPWLPLQRRFQLIAEAGADGVELLLTPGLLQHDPQELAQRARRAGVPVRAVHAVLRVWRDCTLAELEDSVRFALTLSDCSVLVVHPPRPLSQVQQWRQILQLAREHSPRLAIGLETPGQHAVSDRPVPFDNLDFFLRFAEEWDTGITLDTAHVTSLGWDLLETVYRCNRRLTHVHLSDALDRNFRFALANALLRDHRLPGTGCLPLTELLAVLQRSGYHGHLTLELSPFAVLAVRERTVIERLAAAIRSVRQALDRSSDRSPSPKHSSSPEAN